MIRSRNSWVARDKIPASLLSPHDEALSALDSNPNDMQAAVAWLDACDNIYFRLNPILDGPALRAALQADSLKKGPDQSGQLNDEGLHLRGLAAQMARTYGPRG